MWVVFTVLDCFLMIKLFDCIWVFVAFSFVCFGVGLRLLGFNL